MTSFTGRHFLQIPGPTNTPDRVVRALGCPTIDHRSAEFSRLTLEVLDGLRSVFQTAGKVKGKVFRIGHLGDSNDRMLAGTLSGIEMGLDLAGITFPKGGAAAALDYLRATPNP